MTWYAFIAALSGPVILFVFVLFDRTIVEHRAAAYTLSLTLSLLFVFGPWAAWMSSMPQLGDRAVVFILVCGLAGAAACQRWRIPRRQ